MFVPFCPNPYHLPGIHRKKIHGEITTSYSLPSGNHAGCRPDFLAMPDLLSYEIFQFSEVLFYSVGLWLSYSRHCTDYRLKGDDNFEIECGSHLFYRIQLGTGISESIYPVILQLCDF